MFTVYAAGFVRTRPAAQRFAQQAERHPTPATRIAAATPAAESTPIDRSATPATPAAPAATEHKQPTVDAKPVAQASPAATKSAAPRVADRAADSVATPAPAAATTPAASVPAPTPAPAPPPASPTPTRDSSRSAAAPAAPAADSAPAGDREKPRLKDGIFFGWGTSRHGDIQAGIEIKNGRIISAFISECLTQYSCSWIQMLPAQVIARQTPDVDFVSGATQSTNAFYYAVTDALKKAK